MKLKPWQIAAMILVTVLCLGAGWFIVTHDDDDEPREPDTTETSSATGDTPAQPDSSQFEPVTAVIDNRVTNGDVLVEDVNHPPYLSEVPRVFCKRDGCDVPDTDFVHGQEITIFCWVEGDRTTNGNDGDPRDDEIADESTTWVWARHPENDREGYQSVMWLEERFRNQDLESCFGS